MAKRWRNRPEGSTWGDFGEDDQLGRLNLLTPEKVLQGVAEVKAGHSFCLSLPLDYPGKRLLNPRRFPPRLFSTQRGGLANFNFPLHHEDPRLTDVICDDAALICLQYSTQWDSLCHVGSRFDADGDGEAELVFYNGWRAGEHIVAPSAVAEADEFTRFEGSNARRLGVENMAQKGVQGRAVMIDLEKHLGRGRTVVDWETLSGILKADEIVVEEGDMVCLHTGFAQVILDMEKDPDANRLETACAVLDGRDEGIHAWIRDSGIVALIADSYGVEDVHGGVPEGANEPAAFLPLHELCLFKLGVNLGELWYLTELAEWLREAGRSRFLLTAPPLRLPGAVGSPATPVATV